MRWATFIAYFVLCETGLAWELRQLNVVRDADKFEIDASIHIQAPTDMVFAALTDFEKLDQLLPDVKESRQLSDGDEIQVYTRRRSCFLLICLGSVVVEVVTYPAPGVIVSTIDPGRSDFKSGVSSWRLVATKTGTRMDYTANMEPDFWIPRIVGAGAVKRSVKKQLKAIARDLEQRASGTSER